MFISRILLVSQPSRDRAIDSSFCIPRPSSRRVFQSDDVLPPSVDASITEASTKLFTLVPTSADPAIALCLGARALSAGIYTIIVDHFAKSTGTEHIFRRESLHCFSTGFSRFAHFAQRCFLRFRGQRTRRSWNTFERHG